MGTGMMTEDGRSPSGRATRPTDQARSGLGDTASVPNAFTPGPWDIWHDDCARCTKDGHENWFIDGPVGTEHGGFAREADARLIAAAPDLYEACEFVREWLVSPFTQEELDDPNYNETFRKAGKAVLAALAKAQEKAR